MMKLFSMIVLLVCLLTQAMPPASAAEKQTAVVLTTYLTTPTRLAKIRHVADESALEIRVVALEKASAEMLAQSLAGASILLIDAPHSSVAGSIAEKYGKAIAISELPYILIGDFDTVTSGKPLAAGPLLPRHKVDDQLAQRIRELWRYGGNQNTQNLVDVLKRKRFDVVLPSESLVDAIEFPDQGFYHPEWNRIETDLTVVKEKLGAANGIVAIAVNRAVLNSGDTQWLDTLIAELRERDVASYAFYGPRDNAELCFQMTHLGDANTDAIADLIINASLVFRPNELKADLDRCALPVLQTLPSLAMNADQWRASENGLDTTDIAYYYASSELAGMIDPVLITARDSDTGSLRPISGQLEALAEKARAMIHLQKSPASARRVAIVVYNYPLGEGNFGASFLNAPESLVNIFDAMRSRGYNVDSISAEEVTAKVKRALVAFYSEAALVDQLADGAAEFLPLSEYNSWFQTLPTATRQRIEEFWGKPETMTLRQPVSNEPGFALPVVRLGNVSVLAQPLRFEVKASVDGATRKQRIGHRSSVPLSHSYLATYLWIRQQWRADAVVHLGTHGTVEWAPGKERGLSVDDHPYLVLGSLPNIYPFIMDNLGEATTAKRRGRAVMISHLTPMSKPAGFRPGFHEMHELMHEWELSEPGPLRNQIEKTLLAMFVEHRLDKDLNWSTEKIAAEFEPFMHQLHPYLDEIAQAAQPQGLAAFGAVPDQYRRLGMILSILRKPLIEALGEDNDEAFLVDYESIENSRVARWLRLAIRDPEAASNPDLRMIDALAVETKSFVPNRLRDESVDAAKLLSLATRAQALNETLSSNEELDGLLTALDGRHVTSSYGGDPTRNPESLPTGKNLYGFDPRRVPTQQAWRLGIGVFDDWLEQYRTSHNGAMPRKVAFSLWAGETMRHQGVMESQVLYAMGVKPIWDENGRVTGVETISTQELKRNRVDVLLSVTGSYRDQFPLVMQWVDQAVRNVSELSEPGNVVAESTAEIRRALIERGTVPEEAEKLAIARIFSNAPGVYGASLDYAVLATDLWESQTAGGGDAEMAKLFVERMGYAMGVKASASELFASQLSSVDAAMTSRSSTTYGMLTSDDPFTYVGGLSQAARVFSGRSPELYIQNLRDDSEVKVETAARAIAAEMQTRYLHPQWIQSQIDEGYSGTLQVLKATQFLWGWQVTAPETVRQDQWDSMFEVYMQDKYQLGTMEWMESNNQAALAQMAERMLDAVRLGYWQADELIQEKLVQVYDQAKRTSDLQERNPAVTEFVNARIAESPSLLPDASMATSDLSDSIASSPVDSTAQPTPVSGIELKPQVQSELQSTPIAPPIEMTRWLGLIAVGLLVLIGGIRKQRRLNNNL